MAERELGIDISHRRSKTLDEYLNQQFDCVITVCDQANESCPNRRVRDQIMNRVRSFEPFPKERH